MGGRLDPVYVIHERQEGSHAVFGNGPRAGAPKLVVEDLKRDRTIVASRGNRLHERPHVQIAFARHVAEVPRPIEQVHLDPGCIRKLHEKDLVAGNAADAVRAQLPPERVKAVDDQSDAWMVRAPHDLPCIPMVVDMGAPGQRLEAYAQSVFDGRVAQGIQVAGGTVNPAQGLGMHRRTDQHEIGPQLAHHVEFPLGPLEGASPVRLRQSLEVTKGLEKHDLQPMVPHHLPHFGRTAVVGDEILFKDLDSVETRCRDRRELLRQFAGNRNGGDAGLHRVTQKSP